MSILSKIKAFGSKLTKKIKELSIPQSNKAIKELIKEKRRLRNRDFVPGNIIFTSYNAKDKSQTFDKTPLMMVLRRNGTHTLGLNFHWAPLSMRINLIKIIVQMNAKNIQNNKPLEFNYKQIRPLLKQLGYAPIIRLYINKRISSVGVVLPPERLMEAARLRTESFTNGRYTAGQMIQMARKQTKKK